MSFSNDVRDEITDIKINDEREISAFLSAVVAFCGEISLSEGNTAFNIKAENYKVFKKLNILFKKNFSFSLSVDKKNNYNFNRKKIYYLSCTDSKTSNRILEQLGIINIDNDGNIEISNDVQEDVVKSEQLLKTYIRGAYLASGSIANPEKSYHLEFVNRSAEFSQRFSQILNSLNIKSHTVDRKDSYIIYIKESESISDILNIIGAHKCLFKFEDIRIKKQMRNDINRIVNCETANLSKIAKTYVRQKNAIEYIIKKKSLNYLPVELREIALLRLENQDDSLKELGEKLSEPVNKSKVNYRLGKIEKLAQKIYEEEEKNDKKRNNSN